MCCFSRTIHIPLSNIWLESFIFLSLIMFIFVNIFFNCPECDVKQNTLYQSFQLKRNMQVHASFANHSIIHVQKERLNFTLNKCKKCTRRKLQQNKQQDQYLPLLNSVSLFTIEYHGRPLEIKCMQKSKYFNNYE